MTAGAKSSDASLPRFYARNLILLIACGIATTGWILFYTDWFPAFAGLIALSGLLSWLSLVTKLLPEDRIKQLQLLFDQRVLARQGTHRTLWVMLFVQLAVTANVGALEIRPLGISTDLGIWEGGPSKDPPDDFLPAGSSIRLLYLCGPFMPRSIELKIQGHPSQAFLVRGGARSTVIFPRAFQRRVLLLRPSVPRASGIYANPAYLELSWRLRDGTKTATTILSRAHAFWMGTDADVAVPEYLVNRWTLEKAGLDVQDRWRAPRETSLLRDVRVEQMTPGHFFLHRPAAAPASCLLTGPGL